MSAMFQRDLFVSSLQLRVGMSRRLWFTLRKKNVGEQLEWIAGSRQMAVESLSEEIAAEIGYPFLAEIPIVQSSRLPRRTGYRELQRMEIIPLMSEEGITGFCAVNPFVVIKHFSDLAHLPIFISPPGKIREALRRSQSWADTGCGVNTEGSRDIAAESVLEIIVKHVTQSAERIFYLCKDGGKIRYEIRPEKDPKRRGMVENTFSDSLLTICQHAALSGAPVVLAEMNREIFVRYDQKNDEFCLEIFQLQNEKPLALPLQIEPSDDVRGIDDTTRRQIVIVDDDLNFLKVLEKFLSRAGFDLACFASAAEALRYMQQIDRMPVAIVTDLHMPLMGGLEFIERLEALFDVEPPAVVFLTSDQAIESELAALKRGAFAFIAKSRDPRVLVAHLEGIVAREKI